MRPAGAEYHLADGNFGAGSVREDGSARQGEIVRETGNRAVIAVREAHRMLCIKAVRIIFNCEIRYRVRCDMVSELQKVLSTSSREIY